MTATHSAALRLLAAVAAVSTAACTATSATGRNTAAPASPSSASASPSPSPAPTRHLCRSAAVAPRRLNVRSDGVRRTYELSAPRLVGRRPLVVLFHGFDQTAPSIDSYTGMPQAGNAAGFAVATPQGLHDRWNFPRRAAIGPDDVHFVRLMVSAIARRICVDPHEVMVVGFSDGADMADTVACFDRQVSTVAGVAASVPVAGCTRGVDVLQIHGDADPIVPFAGGGGDRPPPFEGTEAVSVSRQMQLWRAVDGCSPERSTTGVLARDVTGIRAVGCRAGRRVVLVVVHGGGHTWPGASVNLPFGDTNHSYRATNRILAFFKQVLDHSGADRGKA